MGKKMKLIPSLLTCNHPRTLSMRPGEDIFKTMNSVFFDPLEGTETPDSWFTNSTESASFSTESDDYFDAESLEMVVRGARSERLFFEPGGTSSILEEAKGGNNVPFKESRVVAMESDDPYSDFRRSMEEMVESQGLKDWEDLEELLGWYLRVNGKDEHGFILGAFVDLLVSLASSSASSSSSSCSESNYYFSTVSSFSSASSAAVSSFVGQNEIDEEGKS